MQSGIWRQLILTGVMALLSHPVSAEAPAEQRPNILFILTDNQAASAIGAYGNPDIKTPHIDRLASEGMRFTRAFAANGMCSPTRATLTTGLMPSQHGVHSWLDDFKLKEWPRDWTAIGEFRTLPLTLKNRGYRTAMIGKWHLGQPTQPGPGFEHWLTFSYGHTFDFWHNTIIENDKSYQIENKHIVDFFTVKAVEYIENHEGQEPFYLQLNFDGPYALPPTNQGPAKNRHYAYYREQPLESFPRGPVHPSMLRELNSKAVEIAGPWAKKQLESLIAMQNDHESMANFASQNSVVDDGVGKVLAALERTGLSENTLVIFSTDQGNLYGQYGIWGHTISTSPSHLYEAALRVPLIIRHPGRIASGKSSELLIGQYDIMSTILDYVGFSDVEVPNSPGRSFAAHLRGEAIGQWRDAVYYEQEETRGLRTHRYAYWKRLSGTDEAELYDLIRDPDQQRNLIADPELAPTIRELDKKLTAFFKQYSTAEYDLWKGGTVKGSTQRPWVFQKIYGKNWQSKTTVKPLFEESL